MSAPASEHPAVIAVRARVRLIGSTIWQLITATVGSCLRYRVTGLAAEAAFFAILSIPPLVFALAGAIGSVSERFLKLRWTRCAPRSSGWRSGP